MKEEVGKRFRECRLGLGYTQAEIAEMMGVKQPVYQRFEKGIFECNYTQLVKLADIYDVTVDYLLGRSEF
ncbi:MAG: helix-turn-helix transcriptional regulator [Clostridia bacterium]|nr:helix-turn-helix transcriptional regulator [Clostridia bacterium]